MMQMIDQTPEEKVAMYMKLTKRELVAMLIANQDIIANLASPSYKVIGDFKTSLPPQNTWDEIRTNSPSPPASQVWCNS